MNEVKLSLILPLYNGESTISRTLDSIVNQHFNYPYEVVIINDNSKDNSLNEVLKYVNILPIHLINVDLNVHCAGNSRQIGLDCCRGEWVTFIDQDDELEENAFNKVFSLIEQNELEYICCTLLYEYNDITGEIAEHTDLRDNIDVWLHGKYYNKKNLLDKYNLRFKEDLVYLEDLYFNTQVLNVLFKIGLIYKPTYTYYITKTYKWHQHGQGTHEKIVEGNYIFNHWGVAHYYCDIVFPIMIDIAKNSKNLESWNATVKMTYSNIGYVFYNYNLLKLNYGKDSDILESLSNSFCKYLPDIISTMKITNVFDYVKESVQFSLQNVNCTPEQEKELMSTSFPEWWSNMLTKCSLIG